MFFRKDEYIKQKNKLNEWLENSIKVSDLKIDDKTIKSIQAVNERVVCLDHGNQFTLNNASTFQEYLEELYEKHQQALKNYCSMLLSVRCTLEPKTASIKKMLIQRSLNELSPLQLEYLYYAAHAKGVAVAGLRNYERSGIEDSTYEKMIEATDKPENELREALGSNGLCHVMEKVSDHSSALRNA